MTITASGGEIRHQYPVCVKKAEFGVASRIFGRSLRYVVLPLGLTAAYLAVSAVWFTLVVWALSYAATIMSLDAVRLFGLAIAIGVPMFYWRRFDRIFVFPHRLRLIGAITAHITVPPVQGGRDSRAPLRVASEGESSYAGQAVVGGRRRVPSSPPPPAAPLLAKPDPQKVAAMIAATDAQRQRLHEVRVCAEQAVAEFAATLDWFGEEKPAPPLSVVYRLFGRVLSISRQYVPDCILSYCIARADENIWAAAGDGIGFFARRWEPVLRTAVVVLAFEYIFTFGVFLLGLGPAAWLGDVLPDSVASWTPLFALGVALVARSALLHPLFFTMVALRYHVEIRDLKFDSIGAATLGRLHPRFAVFTERAIEWESSRRHPQR